MRKEKKVEMSEQREMRLESNRMKDKQSRTTKIPEKSEM